MKRSSPVKSLPNSAVLVTLLLLGAGLLHAETVGKGATIKDFTLKSLKGVSTNTANLRKDKVMVLKFGATWCGWCNKEIPELKKVVDEYKGKNVIVVDVDISEPAEIVRKHATEKGQNYLTLLDEDGAIARQYGIEGIPLVLVVDKQGKIVYAGAYTPFEELKKAIDAAL